MVEEGEGDVAVEDALMASSIEAQSGTMGFVVIFAATGDVVLATYPEYASKPPPAPPPSNHGLLRAVTSAFVDTVEYTISFPDTEVVGALTESVVPVAVASLSNTAT